MNWFTQISMIKNAVRSLTDSLRGTGRTTSVLNTVGNGEVIFVLSSQDQADARRFFQIHKIKADAVAVGTDLARVKTALEGKVYEKIHFDHRVIEALVSKSIECVQGDINHFIEYNDSKLNSSNNRNFRPDYRVKNTDYGISS